MVDSILQQQPDKAIAHKILMPDFFKTVKIGELGQIYWLDAAQMKDERGNSIKCEYDMSPEFVYHHSILT